MKKIIFFAGVLGALSISSTVFASYYHVSPYYNTTNAYNTSISSSYVYTEGCYTYQYDGYTRKLSIISNNCTTNSYYSYPTYPVYQQSTYYTQPAYTYSYQTYPYYTYQYSNNTNMWYPGNYNNTYYSYPYTTNYTDYSYPYYQYGYPYTSGYTNSYYYYPVQQNSGCYYVSGYQACY